MNNLIYFVIVIYNLVRGYEYAKNVTETEYTAEEELNNYNCENQNQLPVGTAGNENILYLFNKNKIKIAILNNPTLENEDSEEFIRVLISATIVRREVDKKEAISRYILSDHKIEDYKYKFSTYFSNEINNNSNCDIRCNVTYRMNNVNSLCDIAKVHIESVINGIVNENVNIEIYKIKERSVDQVTRMMRDISLDLSCFDSLNLYRFYENKLRAIFNNCCYKYWEDSRHSFGIEKEVISTVEDKEMRRYCIDDEDCIFCVKLKSEDDYGYCGGRNRLIFILAFAEEISTKCILYE